MLTDDPILVERRDSLMRQCQPHAELKEELEKAPIETQIYCLAMVVGFREAIRPHMTKH